MIPIIPSWSFIPTGAMPTQKIKTMSTTTIPTLIYIVGVDIKVGIVGR
jgi:hypothetical protein